MYGSWGIGSTIRSWIPAGLPGSKWNQSKARRGGKGRKRSGKRALTKKAKRTRRTRNQKGGEKTKAELEAELAEHIRRWLADDSTPQHAAVAAEYMEKKRLLLGEILTAARREEHGIAAAQAAVDKADAELEAAIKSERARYERQRLAGIAKAEREQRLIDAMQSRLQPPRPPPGSRQ